MRGIVDVAEGAVGMAMSTDVRVVESGIVADSRARRAVWRRCGRIARLVLTPVEDSSSGKLRI